MALPPKFKGHRLLFTGDAASTVSNEPLHTVEFYLDYVCPFSASNTHPTLLQPPTPLLLYVSCI